MAKDRSRQGEARAENTPPSNVRVNGGDILSAARGFDGESFEKGYPDIMELHNNQGRGGGPGVTKVRGR